MLTILSAEVIALLILSGENIKQWIDKTQEELRFASFMQKVHEGNISYHTPDSHNFHAFLSRDLTAYFREKYKDCQTSYEMLKDEPTQFGLSFPHFYVWAKVTRKNSIITQGAVRLDGYRKEGFFVTDFYSVYKIRTNPKLIEHFPPSIWEKAWQKAGVLPR